MADLRNAEPAWLSIAASHLLLRPQQSRRNGVSWGVGLDGGQYNVFIHVVVFLRYIVFPAQLHCNAQYSVENLDYFFWLFRLRSPREVFCKDMCNDSANIDDTVTRHPS